jgi:hypothetical protein
LEIDNTHHASRITKQFDSKFIFASWLLALGLLLAGIGGAFAPWVWRPGVALQLTGPGLAEFVKFLPEIRLGQIEIERLYFLLPLFTAMLLLPLFAGNKALMLPAWLRWLLRLAVMPLALASLSPVWAPAILMAAEFRLQTILAGVAIGLAVIAPLFKSLPLKILVVVFMGGGLAAIILPYRHFALVQASIEEAYRQPVSLGWGWWLAVAGIVIGMIGGAYLAFFSKAQGIGP